MARRRRLGDQLRGMGLDRLPVEYGPRLQVVGVAPLQGFAPAARAIEWNSAARVFQRPAHSLGAQAMERLGLQALPLLQLADVSPDPSAAQPLHP